MHRALVAQSYYLLNKKYYPHPTQMIQKVFSSFERLPIVFCLCSINDLSQWNQPTPILSSR